MRQVIAQVSDETFVKIGTYVAQEKLKRKVTQQELMGQILAAYFIVLEKKEEKEKKDAV
jgi:hypothetical protein